MKSITDFTKEELFKFYDTIRMEDTWNCTGFHKPTPNEYLLDEIDRMVRDMEKPKDDN